MTAPRRRRRLWFVLLGIALACALAVLVSEWCLRAFDLFGVNHGPNTLRYRTEAVHLTVAPGGDYDGTLFRHNAGSSVGFGGFTITTNALGFRGPEVAVAKPADVFRVLVLGDSVALGWGVDDGVTFCRRLERETELADGRRLEVINTGHLMYDSMQEAALLEREGLRLSPDLVLLVFVVNDIEPTSDLARALLEPQTAVQGAAAPTVGDRVAHFFEGWLPAWTALLRNLGAQGGATAIRAGEAVAVQPAQIRNGEVGWQRAQQALRRMRDACAGAGVPFLLLDHSLPPLAPLPGFCAEQGIRYRELRFTAEELAQPIYNSMIDTHANARGHALLLGKLRAALRAEKLLPPEKGK